MKYAWLVSLLIGMGCSHPSQKPSPGINVSAEVTGQLPTKPSTRSCWCDGGQDVGTYGPASENTKCEKGYTLKCLAATGEPTATTGELTLLGRSNGHTIIPSIPTLDGHCAHKDNGFIVGDGEDCRELDPIDVPPITVTREEEYGNSDWCNSCSSNDGGLSGVCTSMYCDPHAKHKVTVTTCKKGSGRILLEDVDGGKHCLKFPKD